MTRIKVLGGTGYGGSAIVAEAARRGHQVTSYSRTPATEPVEGVTYVHGSALDDALLQETVQDADVVFATISPRGDMAGQVEGVVGRLMAHAELASVRLGVLGGVSSTLVSPDGPRYFDEHPPPDEVLPEVITGMALLDALRTSPDGLDWFYVSPAASFGSWLPQRVTGGYRTSDDVLLTDEHGESYIAAPDLALAVLDEIERPTRHRRRFHVAL